MKPSKRVLSFLLLASLLLGLIGCQSQTPSGGQTSQTNPPQAPTSSQTSTGADPTQAPAGEGVVFPLAEPVTVTWWMELDSKTSTTLKSYEDVAAYKAVEELTGINIEWQHPPTGQTTEQFNLMCASRELPDIIHYGNWFTGYTGGPSKAIADGIIIDLAGLQPTYAPNITRMYEENPDIKLQSMTDAGEFFMVPSISFTLYSQLSEEKPAFYTAGWQIRADWVEKLNLELPESIDDWYTVLTAFKTGDPNGNGENDEIPWTGRLSTLDYLVWPWGIAYGWYHIDGQVHYGPYDEVYRDVLTTLNKWYSEGLIDQDYVTNDGSQVNSKVTSGLAGSWNGAISGSLGTYITAMTRDNPDVHLTGTIFPRVGDGTSYSFRTNPFQQVGNSGAAISTVCKHPEIALALLDFGFTEEGYTLYNWGTEGVSYTILENGDYQLTDEIFHNADGLSVDQSLARFAPAANGGPFCTSGEMWSQRMYMPEQQEAISRWAVGSGERLMPNVTPTVEESSELADKLNQIQTYRDEMRDKFIMGIEPISKFDDYIQTLKSLGIEDCIKIYQAAYDRYIAR